MEFKKEFETQLGKITDFSKYKEFAEKFPRKSIRVNTLKIKKEDLLKRIKVKEQVPWCSNAFYVEEQLGNTLEHCLGYFYIQEAAAMIPPLVLDPSEDDLVLDLCASPGGKTTQLAALMNNKGIIIANDINVKRIDILKQNLQRLGVLNTAITFNFKQREFFFDKILVDAPCSGTGKIRGPTDQSKSILKEWSPQIINKLAITQKNLLLNAFDSLKEQGTLVYSTCSIQPEENEKVIEFLLNNRNNAKLKKIEININHKEAVSENREIKNNCLRLWPQDNDTEGFFVAKIIKV